MSDIRFDVELTNACNAQCVFCPHPQMTRETGNMSWRTWEQVIKQAKAVDIMRLTVAGFGEPTLHPEVIHFLKWARSQLPDTWIQLVTNGSLLWHLDLDTLTEAGLTDIVISFTGYSPDSYESLMRGLSFRKTLRGLNRLVESLKDLETEIRIRGIRLPPDPESSRQRTVKFLRSLGFEPRTDEFYPLHNRGGLVYSYHASQERVCEEFANTLAIGWDGTVPLCIGDMFHKHVVGNIHDNTAVELIDLCLTARSMFSVQKTLCNRCDIAEVFRPIFGAAVG